MSIQPFNPAGEVATQTNLPTSTGTIQLAEWAAELGAAHKLGTALCKTAFVPKDFMGKPEAAAAAILAGKSLGLDPMNALSNIFVVHGRPALYARTMTALVMAQGHEVVRTEATPESVTVAGRRKGQERWQEFTWTIARAKTAGYTSNSKYQSDPIAMLTAKALAEACRTIAPDVLAGMPYSAEEMELEDMGEKPQAPEPVKTQKITRKPAQKKSEAVERPEPEPVADVVTGEVQDDGPAAVLETDWEAELAAASGSRDSLIELWNRAVAEGAPQEMVSRIVDAGSKFA
ncbi:putative RecT-like ssDNA binding protein [Glutamicibacter phage BIM BV-113]|nr:putative RecT-like ssDNA binding protein [Glutamicibacter phage BIM BV-113]